MTDDHCYRHRVNRWRFSFQQKLQMLTSIKYNKAILKTQEGYEMGYAKYHEDDRELRDERLRRKEKQGHGKKKCNQKFYGISMPKVKPYNGIKTCYGCW